MDGKHIHTHTHIKEDNFNDLPTFFSCFFDKPFTLCFSVAPAFSHLPLSDQPLTAIIHHHHYQPSKSKSLVVSLQRTNEQATTCTDDLPLAVFFALFLSFVRFCWRRASILHVDATPGTG